MMKMKWKQTLAILLAAALSLAATGCALKDKKASDSDASASAYSEKELAKVAVKVGEKYTVTKGDIVDQYNYMVQMYTSYGMSAPTADADIESMQDSVVSSLVSDKIQLYETDLMGITLTDKEKADVEAKVEEEMKYYTDSFRSQAVDEGAADPDARALEIFQEQLDSAGMDMDVDGFRAYVTDQYTNEALKAALKAKVTVDVTATDEEIKTYYDTNLATPAGQLHQDSGGFPLRRGIRAGGQRRSGALRAGRICARAHNHGFARRGSYGRVYDSEERFGRPCR